MRQHCKPELNIALDIVREWDKCFCPVRLNLRNGNCCLLKADSILAAERINENNAVQTRLVGEQNCIARGVGKGRQIWKLALRAIVPIGEPTDKPVLYPI